MNEHEIAKIVCERYQRAHAVHMLGSHNAEFTIALSFLLNKFGIEHEWCCSVLQESNLGTYIRINDTGYGLSADYYGDMRRHLTAKYDIQPDEYFLMLDITDNEEFHMYATANMVNFNRDSIIEYFVDLCFMFGIDAEVSDYKDTLEDMFWG